MKGVSDVNFARYTKVLVSEHEQIQSFGEGRSYMARIKALRPHLLKIADDYDVFQKYLDKLTDAENEALKHSLIEAWDITSKPKWNNMTVKCRLAMLPQVIWDKVMTANEMSQKYDLLGQVAPGTAKAKKKTSKGKGKKKKKKTKKGIAMLQLSAGLQERMKQVHGQSLVAKAGLKKPPPQLSGTVLQNTIQKCNLAVTEKLYDQLIAKEIATRDISHKRTTLMQAYRIKLLLLIVSKCATLVEVEELPHNNTYTVQYINRTLTQSVGALANWTCRMTDDALELLYHQANNPKDTVTTHDMTQVLTVMTSLPDDLRRIGMYLSLMAGHSGGSAVSLGSDGLYTLPADVPDDVREGTTVRDFTLGYLNNKKVQVITRLGDAHDEKTFEHVWVNQPFAAAKCSVAFGWNMFEGDEKPTSVEEMRSMVRVFMKLNQVSDECVFRITTAPLEVTHARDALKEFHNCSGDMEFTIWKKMHKELLPTNAMTMISNIETQVTAYYSKKKVKSTTMFHPRSLDSVQELPYVRNKMKDSDGEVYNHAEEHPLVYFTCY